MLVFVTRSWYLPHDVGISKKLSQNVGIGHQMLVFFLRCWHFHKIVTRCWYTTLSQDVGIHGVNIKNHSHKMLVFFLRCWYFQSEFYTTLSQDVGIGHTMLVFVTRCWHLSHDVDIYNVNFTQNCHKMLVLVFTV